MGSDSVDMETLFSEIEDYYLQEELISLVNDADVQSSSKRMDAGTHQQKVVSLFYHIWFKNELNATEINLVKAFLKSELISTPYKSLIVASLILSLLHYFDAAKIA